MRPAAAQPVAEQAADAPQAPAPRTRARARLSMQDEEPSMYKTATESERDDDVKDRGPHRVSDHGLP